jgi:hypothetical protein
VATVEHVGDVVDLFRAQRGVASGDPWVSVAQAGGHNVDGQAARVRRRGPSGRFGRPRRAGRVPPGQAGWAAGRGEEDWRSAGCAVDELEKEGVARRARIETVIAQAKLERLIVEPLSPHVL